MQTQKVRLLNSSVYYSGTLKKAPYPIIVDALVDFPYEGLAKVITGVEGINSIDVNNDNDVLKYMLSNTPFFNKEDCNSWQVVSGNPFDYWNRLKNSRDDGEMPKTDTFLN